MRLDHLLSKESMPVISTGHSQVEHWLIGEISISANAEPPFLLEGTPARQMIDPSRCRRTSLFRFEGTATLVVPGGAPSHLVEQTAPCVPATKKSDGDRSACRADP